MTYARHQMDVYGSWLHLATNARAWAVASRAVPDLGDLPDSAGLCQAVAFQPEGSKTELHVVVWIDVSQHTLGGAGLVNTVAHEAAHAALSITEHFEHGPIHDEPTAYLVGWVAEWLWSRLPAVP